MASIHDVKRLAGQLGVSCEVDEEWIELEKATSPSISGTFRNTLPGINEAYGSLVRLQTTMAQLQSYVPPEHRTPGFTIFLGYVCITVGIAVFLWAVLHQALHLTLVHHPFPGYGGFISFVAVLALWITSIASWRKRKYTLSAICFALLLAYGCWQVFL